MLVNEVYLEGNNCDDIFAALNEASILNKGFRTKKSVINKTICKQIATAYVTSHLQLLTLIDTV